MGLILQVHFDRGAVLVKYQDIVHKLIRNTQEQHGFAMMYVLEAIHQTYRDYKGSTWLHYNKHFRPCAPGLQGLHRRPRWLHYNEHFRFWFDSDLLRQIGIKRKTLTQLSS